MWGLKTDPEVMGIYFIHGATTFKEVSVEELVGGAESEGSFLLEFPDTITSNEGFAEYLREKKRKTCGGWVDLFVCLSTGGVLLSTRSMALVKNRLSSTKSSSCFQKQPQKEPWV